MIPELFNHLLLHGASLHDPVGLLVIVLSLIMGLGFLRRFMFELQLMFFMLRLIQWWYRNFAHGKQNEYEELFGRNLHRVNKHES